MRPFAIAVVLVSLAASAAVSEEPPPTLAIRNVTLIDGTGRPPTAGVSILITGDRFTRVATGDVALPPSVRVIDGAGLTVIPGLIDTHIHSRPWAWPLFLRFGVTTVRDVGSDPDAILNDRALERRGELVAPRIFACGPLLDGIPPVWGTQWRGSVGLDSVDAARAIAQRLLDRGVDCLKVYSRLPADRMRAIVEMASARGVPVAGHLGTVTAQAAVEMGVQSIEHASGLGLPLSAEAQEALIGLFLKSGTFIVPTMLVTENIANLPVIGNDRYPNLNLVPQGQVREWLNWRNNPLYRDSQQQFAPLVRARAEFVRAFHRAGGRLVAGSDTPNPFVIPGFSLHQELESLVAAGLSPLEAIRAATSTAAALLRRTDLGTVEEGKLADLLLVSGNPSTDITATRNVRVVIRGGTVVYESR